MSFSDTPIEKFIYDAATKTLVADASTLGFAPGKFPKTIMIKGRKRVLYQRTVVQPSVVCYEPTAKSIEFTPACNGIVVKVFNT